MNKNDLAGIVADKTGMSKAEATRAIEAALEGITEALRSGNEVRLVGFGTFLASNRAASVGRNPRTGEPIQIAAARIPKFKAGKVLKEALN